MSQQEEKQESEKVKELMAGIQKTMPQEIYQELEKNKVVSETDGTILIGNDKDEPSLRLDFTYENGKLVQFVNKEYGFFHSLPEIVVNEEQAKQTAQTFAKVFLNQDVHLKKITDLSGYDTGDYITFEDDNHNTYLVQLSLNLFLKYNDSQFLESL